MYEITDTPTYHGKPVIVVMNNETKQLCIMPRRMSGLIMSISNIHHSVFVPDIHSFISKTEKNVINTILVLIISFVLFMAVGLSTRNTTAAFLSSLIPTLIMVLLVSANKIVERKITKIDKINTVMTNDKLVKALRYSSPEVSELIDIMKDADSSDIKYNAARALLSHVDIVDNNDRLFSKNGRDNQSTLNRIKEITENAKSVVEIQDQAEHEIRKLSKEI